MNSRQLSMYFTFCRAVVVMHFCILCSGSPTNAIFHTVYVQVKICPFNFRPTRNGKTCCQILVNITGLFLILSGN